jgi:hypothetical protein
MFRFAGWSALLVCAFASSASAATINAERALRLPESELGLVLEPSFQEAVTATAPVEWHDTRGADVWRMSLDGMTAHVQVFPTLYRPGAGQPHCCVSFEFGDTEFWLKIRGAFPPTGLGSHVGQSGKGSPPDDGRPPSDRPMSDRPMTSPALPSSGAPSAGGPPVEGSAAGGPPAAAPAAIAPLPPSAGGGVPVSGDSKDPGTIPTSVEREKPAAGGGFVPAIGEVPEPSLLVLVGLAACAAARRIRPSDMGSGGHRLDKPDTRI